MALIECPKCHFKYNPSYKKCPMCEEERLKRKGMRASGRKIRGKGQKYSFVTALAVTLIVVVLLTIPFLLSDKIAEWKNNNQGTGNSQNAAGNMTDHGQDSGNASNGNASVPEQETVNLNRTELVLSAELPTFQLEVTGNKGKPSWVSGDERIVLVTETGLVSAVGDGQTFVSAQVDGQEMQCSVSVYGICSDEPSNTATPEVDVSAISLNHTDFTAVIGEKVQMRVRGTDAPVAWRIADADGSIATISSDGVVTAVGRGRTTVYADVGGATLECIVRVSGGA